MDAADIKFNSDLRMSLKIDQQPESVLLFLSDDLEASEQTLELPYKEKIAKFINASATWHPLAMDKIKKQDGDPGKARVTQIHVLSEQDADAITFGLLCRVEIDVEHGRGIKIDGETLQILKYGIGDVALS